MQNNIIPILVVFYHFPNNFNLYHANKDPDMTSHFQNYASNCFPLNYNDYEECVLISKANIEDNENYYQVFMIISLG